jgi:BioD-like phosphotransacetylase family protein
MLNKACVILYAGALYCGVNRVYGGFVSTIYIAGTSSGAGTTAVATGLATLLATNGTSVTLSKALCIGASASLDADAAFHQTLFPDNAAPAGLPVSVDGVPDAAALGGITATLKGAKFPSGLTIVEGVSGNVPDDERYRIDATLAESLDARVILVSSATSASPIKAAQAFGARLIGTVINRVPDHAMHQAAMALAASFQEQGVTVLGLIPETRIMLSLTVGEIAEHLGAELLNGTALISPESQLGELVEHFMLGGLFLDQGVYVFGRRENKAVIVRGDRPDLQMAALDTSTACLILTNRKTPVQYIAHHAGLRQTPMLATSAPTLEIMEKLCSIGDRGSVHSPHKAQCFAELLGTCCDLVSLVSLSTT